MTIQEQILAAIPAGGIRARDLRLKCHAIQPARFDAVLAQLVGGWRISINNGQVRLVTEWAK